MNDALVGKILAIALRTSVRGPMREVESVQAFAGGGLEGDVPSSKKRGVTFLASDQWDLVNRELEVALPWYTRRANILVDAASLGHLIGKQLRFGEVRVHVHAETEPCEQMEELLSGLRKTLVPDCRGGVYGEILEGGTIAVGEEIVCEGQAN